MADVVVTHKFVSGKADGPDPTLVQPSKWNQDHNFGAGVDGQVLVRDSAQVDGANWLDLPSVSGGAYAVIVDYPPDAVVRDRETNTYADFKKVRPINFSGKYYKSRGPLNTVRSPQGRPVFVQAGGSPRGRQFAAKSADSIIAVANGVEGMKSYRDDVRARAAAQGRNPDDIKVLFTVSPMLAETRQAAQDKMDAWINGPDYIVRTLAGISFQTYYRMARYGFFVLILVLQVPFVRSTLQFVTVKSQLIIGSWFGMPMG